jgi:hypothetical protein
LQTSSRRHLRYANEQSTHHFWLCKTGRHDRAEILLKVALNTKNQIKSNPLVKHEHNISVYQILIQLINFSFEFIIFAKIQTCKRDLTKVKR